MRRLDAYEQPTPNWTRIEMLLAAFDGVMLRLRQAEELREQKQDRKAQPLLLRAQQIVLELYSGLDLKYGEVSSNMRNLYLFVLNSIGLGESLNIPAALDVLAIIRDGLESIRETANQMEHRGQIPHARIQTRVLEHVTG